MAKRLLALATLVVAFLVCVGVIFCRPDQAPMVRLKLAWTMRTLPPPPSGVTLLGEFPGSASGTDCSAFVVDRVYGTNRSLADVARYYEQELKSGGWRTVRAYSPGAPEALALRTGRDELLYVLTPDSQLCDWVVRQVPAEKLAQFETIYTLDVTRTCGRFAS